MSNILHSWVTSPTLYTGDQEADSHSSWAPWSYMQMGETYRRTTSLHLGFMGGVAKLNPLLSEDEWKHTWNLQKAPKGPSDSEKQDYVVWWTSILSIMFEGNQLCSSPAEYNPNSGDGGTFFLNLNKMKTKRISNHMSQYFIRNRA